MSRAPSPDVSMLPAAADPDDRHSSLHRSGHPIPGMGPVTKQAASALGDVLLCLKTAALHST
ncbi:hypothetical protein [Rhodococcus sp. ARC_M6]|uniref:hypothetical protein n=1 Tax=Rhodococcus sp. ARC_M6 TaxID=2928852 RepID=UPI001FB3C2EA|nr:hypothetical protein [Rhodococcus sp. ARC_M6]MCJ0901876.1 hypothetical protein [Rhodococcus sp. ARC_M6]